MLKYAIRRMIYVLPTLWAVVTFVFFLIRIVPGGPAVAALGSYATAESIRQLEKQMGLDKPILVQYGKFLKDLCQGDLGKSLITNKPISQEISRALPYTLDLAIGGMIIGILFGIPTGIITALRRNRPPDYIGRILSLVGISMPEFYLGILLMYHPRHQIATLPCFRRGRPQQLKQPVVPSVSPGPHPGHHHDRLYQSDGALLHVERAQGRLCENSKGQRVFMRGWSSINMLFGMP